MKLRRFPLLWLALVVAGAALATIDSPLLLAPRSALSQDLESKKIVPFVPSPQEVVDKMIELADVQKDDVVYDLGSGDGRIVITAAKKGAKAVGFDIDPQLVKESRENIRKAGVEDRAEIRNQDILTVDLSPASGLQGTPHHVPRAQPSTSSQR